MCYRVTLHKHHLNLFFLLTYGLKLVKMYKYSIWFSDFNNISGHYFVFEGKLVNFLTKQTNNVYVTTAKERSLNHLLHLRPPEQCVPAVGTRVCRVFKEQATATKNRPPNASHLFSDF